MWSVLDIVRFELIHSTKHSKSQHNYKNILRPQASVRAGTNQIFNYKNNNQRSSIEDIYGVYRSGSNKSLEEVRRDAQPVKNLMKMFPVSKSFIQYFAMFNEEFAKEYDITISKTAR